MRKVISVKENEISVEFVKDDYDDADLEYVDFSGLEDFFDMFCDPEPTQPLEIDASNGTN